MDVGPGPIGVKWDAFARQGFDVSCTRFFFFCFYILLQLCQTIARFFKSKKKFEKCFVKLYTDGDIFSGCFVTVCVKYFANFYDLFFIVFTLHD